MPKAPWIVPDFSPKTADGSTTWATSTDGPGRAAVITARAAERIARAASNPGKAATGSAPNTSRALTSPVSTASSSSGVV